MSHILVFGAINLDHIDTVPHIVRPGDIVLLQNEDQRLGEYPAGGEGHGPAHCSGSLPLHVRSAGLAGGMPVPAAMALASRAAALCVSRSGAVSSIPARAELTAD